MQLHPNILNLGHDLLDEFPVLLPLLNFSSSEFDSDYHLFKDIVIEVVLSGYLLPLVEHFLEFEVHAEGLGVDLVEGGEEVLA